MGFHTHSMLPYCHARRLVLHPRSPMLRMNVHGVLQHRMVRRRRPLWGRHGPERHEPGVGMSIWREGRGLWGN